MREFRAEDEPDIHEYGSDPIVSRYCEWGPNTPQDTHAMVALRCDAQRKWPRDEVDLATELVDVGKVIGSITLAVVSRAHQTGMIGYAFSNLCWNRGYATEAAAALVRTGFEVLGLHRIWATCDTRNVASWRVMEKIGMRREAFFRRDVLQKGEWRDSYLYAALREEHEVGYARD
ncbi:MAG TPA: GNAT family protein [Candidatus Tumulicola sp.]